MSKTIYFKNFRSTALIVLLSFIVLGGTFSYWSYRSTMSEKRTQMTSAAHETRRYIEAYVPLSGAGLSDTRVSMELSAISRVSGIDIFVAGVDGIIAACSDEPYLCPHLGQSVPQELLAHLAESDSWTGVGATGGLYDNPRYIVANALATDGARYGYMFASIETAEMVDTWRRFLGIFIMLALSVMCMTFIVSLLTTRRQAEALTDMAKAARKFAHGDFAVRVGSPNTTRDDEIGELERAFNSMADYLSRSETRRKELLANVSHELKTPMTVISGFADGILDGTIPRENEEKYLEAISSETKRLSRLVRSILDAARDEETLPDAAAFNIGEVMIQTLLGLSSKLDQKGMEADPQMPEEPIFVLGDRDSITQVVYNLIDNAVKFADVGSTLRLSLYKQGERAFVTVEDTGAVIPEAEMPLIFDRFHKVDHSRATNRDGVGLGLYIVKTILDHHNQDIFVESADGVTRFTFTLTIAPSKSGRER
ncbi:MAG: HAMP domain-containing histidine kinase [Oscillospiraceae bacterium]|jgi:signal transduction histidine kinase|nr:HAMP domain-containing histidine kinase [Oscillospiraceae bacterium]